MTERPTAWKPGQSGNPNGRPKKTRTLTAALEAALSKRIPGEEGNVSGKRWLGERIAEGLQTGKITLDGKELVLSPQDWLDMQQWAYKQIDGPPPTDTNVNLSGSVTLVLDNQWQSVKPSDSQS